MAPATGDGGAGGAPLPGARPRRGEGLPIPYDPAFSRVYDFVVHNEAEALATDAEWSFVQWALRRSPRDIMRDVLDLGCGKGRFLVPLARAGHRVTGVDDSHHMLADCRARLKRRGLRATLVQADVATLDADRAFDAILCMDSVICYFLDTDEILALLSRCHRALRPHGVLVLDVWNIWAQRELFGKSVQRRFANDRVRVEWSESYAFDEGPAVLRTRLAGRVIEDDGAQEFDREEVLRALTAEEMKVYLETTGFVSVVACADHDPDNGDTDKAEALAFAATRP